MRIKNMRIKFRNVKIKLRNIKPWKFFLKTNKVKHLQLYLSRLYNNQNKNGNKIEY